MFLSKPIPSCGEMQEGGAIGSATLPMSQSPALICLIAKCFTVVHVTNPDCQRLQTKSSIWELQSCRGRRPASLVTLMSGANPGWPYCKLLRLL